MAARTSRSGPTTGASWRSAASAPPSPIRSTRTASTPPRRPAFEGRRVITEKGEKGDANGAVIEALIAAGNLLARGRVKHQYPHSWRSKKPVIFRNTPQWFIAMDQDIRNGDGTPAERPATLAGNYPDTLRARALAGIKTVEWVPAAGENRITGMIANRPDWVVSRQRAWGVPITVFAKERGDGSVEILKDPEVNARIAAAFEAEGADAWFKEGATARFLGARAAEGWAKVNDVLDVWFDSGSTHTFTLEARPDLKATRAPNGRDKVMYLEGSDQHRGWFHSSLLESCGTRGRPPYDAVLTHGFVLDEDGRKMSKSLGNVTSPQDVIKTSGADILRLWVCASDYSDDLRIGPEILKTTADTYRKLRNTLRWLLGSLHHFRPDERVAFADMPSLERFILHRLSELERRDPRRLPCLRLQESSRAAHAVHEHRAVGLLFRRAQRRALLRSAVLAHPQGRPDGAGRDLQPARDLAGAHHALHHRRGLSRPYRRRRGLGAPAGVPRHAAGLARRHAGGAVAQGGGRCAGWCSARWRWSGRRSAWARRWRRRPWSM